MYLQMLLTAVQPVYDLTVIEEDAVPLAGSFLQSGAGRFNSTTGMMFAVAMAAIVLVYALYCNARRTRVLELMRFYRQDGYRGWNPSHLKKESERLEAEIVEQAENRKSYYETIQYYEYNDFDDYEDDFDHEVSELDVML